MAVAAPLCLPYVVTALGLIGLLIRWARRQGRASSAAWLMGLIVLVAVLLPGPAGHPRFRVPIAPLLSVAAAAGWLGRRHEAPAEVAEPNVH